MSEENPTPAEVLEETRGGYWQLKAELEMLKIVTHQVFELLAGLLGASIEPERIMASIAKHRDDIAQNCADAEKSSNENKGQESANAQNCAPSLTGAAAAKLVKRREERKGRDVAALLELIGMVVEKFIGNVDVRRIRAGDFGADGDSSAIMVLDRFFN